MGFQFWFGALTAVAGILLFLGLAIGGLLFRDAVQEERKARDAD